LARNLLLPEFDTVFTALVVGSFVAAFANAAFSVGGAVVILAITTVVLPITAVVPIHSTLLLGSTLSRVILFRDFIAWRIVKPFLIGSAAGALLGSRLYFEIPERAIAAAIAIIMLGAIWMPRPRWRSTLPHPWLGVGFVHSLLSTLFAYGAILHAVILHTGLERRAVVGTLGGCLMGMSVFKISGYALNGFDYSPYISIIVSSIIVSYIGTWIGRRVVSRLSEQVFRLIFRVLVTVTAIRLIWVNIGTYNVA